MKPILVAHDLTKRYPGAGSELALKPTNFEVEAGSLFGIVGSDGAGKTTLLRLLATVLQPSRGSANVAGYDIEKETEAVRRVIGYAPQEFSQYPDLSLLENLKFFANIQHVPQNEQAERIDKMLTFTNMKQFSSRRAGKLSGGMKKKLALACAMVHNPRILILDEPSTGVDPVSRRELWNLLGEVITQGVTVILSTPYMDEAERCSHTAMLSHGRIILKGTPSELIKALPFRVVEVNASPRKAMRAAVSKLEDVLDWTSVGDRLRIALGPQTDIDEFMDRLRVGLEHENASIRILREAHRTMGDVFIHQVLSERDHESED